SGTRANIAIKIFGDDLTVLRALARQVQETISPIRGVVDLTTEQQTDIPLVRVDPVLLHHCLINLLDNAGRYADPDTPITIRARRTADAIELSVIDQGPGIAPGNEKRVFETFTRLEGSDRAKHGTGLGLAIVKGFAEAMGLSVAAGNNGDPHGACFTIRIPEALIITQPIDKDSP
ncbi:MAG: ATP-binding protein, partial [Sphingopyxis sp.]|nr:ATP-binding protein [Sphingopyxis sp.]